MRKKFGHWIYWNVDILILAACLIAIISAVVACIRFDKVEVQRGIENYNNGVCKECGEILGYKGSSRDRNTRYDYYICPNGHVVEVYRGSGN